MPVHGIAAWPYFILAVVEKTTRHAHGNDSNPASLNTVHLPSVSFDLVLAAFRPPRPL